MKKVIKRQIQEMTFIWSTLLIMLMMIDLIQSLYEDYEPSVSFGVFLVFVVIYLIGTVIWVGFAFSKHTMSKGSRIQSFLSSQVVILDEDERGLLIHYKSSEKSTNIIFITIFTILTILFTLRIFTISISLLIMLLGVVYTLYCVSYLIYLRKYYSE